MINSGSPPPGGWPVIVWFHGGDFNTGTPAIWDATVFVNKQKVSLLKVNVAISLFPPLRRASPAPPIVIHVNYGDYPISERNK